MQLAEARSAKQQVREALVRHARPAIRARMAVAHMAADELEQRRPVAIGIARFQAAAPAADAQSYGLAIRIQSEGADGDDDEIMGIARDMASSQAVDLQYVGRIRALQLPWYREQQRPVLIGCSVGHPQVTAGTVGAFVRDRETGRLCLLSNNHVIANVNDAQPGDDIYQPGRLDDGAAAHRIGSLRRFIALDFDQRNEIDAAIAEIADGIDCDRATLRDLGILNGLRAEPVDLEEPVVKIGRTTGLTRGRVTAIELDDVAVDYDGSVAVFDNQFEVRSPGGAFSQGGDSGSLIVDEDGMAVGLLFAGTGAGLTYANYIHPVLDRLGIELVMAEMVAGGPGG